MVTYITLAKFTDQGIRTIKDTTKRADMAKELAAKFGVKLTGMYWTLGEYDIVLVGEAPDDAAIAAFGYAIGSAGNVRSATLKAFSKDEVSAILSKLP
ncbi:GYD domain-containing protein [Undibacterium sp.]|jgi:uncharacterized protein with GYD domain|uniref:GYD domain-containing protein n=1 Tax=Undibacterium sp. TaxID=1914977 RepID=UPI002B58D9CB|nr:GYD domain-containing protein [Undibacterium sp.]HTD02736.1 GYD domain-containing protein [Undibacterium sp.]